MSGWDRAWEIIPLFLDIIAIILVGANLMFPDHWDKLQILTKTLLGRAVFGIGLGIELGFLLYFVVTGLLTDIESGAHDVDWLVDSYGFSLLGIGIGTAFVMLIRDRWPRWSVLTSVVVAFGSLAALALPGQSIDHFLIPFAITALAASGSLAMTPVVLGKLIVQRYPVAWIGAGLGVAARLIQIGRIL